jgi:hypothetical protein
LGVHAAAMTAILELPALPATSLAVEIVHVGG